MALPPPRAVALLLILAVVINVLVLSGERRRTEVDRRGVVVLLAAALPGLVVGAALLRVLPADALRVGIGAVVLALVALRVRHVGEPRQPRSAGRLGGPGRRGRGRADDLDDRQRPADRAAARRPRAAARRRAGHRLDRLPRARPGGPRRGAGRRRLPPQPGDAELLRAFLPLVLLGHRLGLWAFRRLPSHRYEQILLLVVAAAAVVSISSGLPRPF